MDLNLSPPGGAAMLSVRRILFPTDFSEPADYAWSYALTFAQETSRHSLTPLRSL